MEHVAPQIVIIAGPNGAGKTTFAREFLPAEADCPLFINADLIETTLSGYTYVKRIPAWRERGFAVKLIFLSLQTPEEAIARVATRVQQGGHDVAAEVA